MVLKSLQIAPAYVYMISSNLHIYKIGFSNLVGDRVIAVTPMARRNGLDDLEIKHLFYTPYARLWEKFFHELFAEEFEPDVPGREWFRLSMANRSLFCSMPDSVYQPPFSERFWQYQGQTRQDVLSLCLNWSLQFKPLKD